MLKACWIFLFSRLFEVWGTGAPIFFFGGEGRVVRYSELVDHFFRIVPGLVGPAGQSRLIFFLIYASTHLWPHCYC